LTNATFQKNSYLTSNQQIQVMKNKLLMLFGVALLFGSCTGEDSEIPAQNALPIGENKVLLLKVDYTTNAFEGGKEFDFQDDTESFTIETQHQQAGDFGGIKLYYQELDEKLFEGSIHWNGLGAMSFPESLQPASSFEHVLTEDFAICLGFDNVFNPQQQELDYNLPWSSIQGLVKVRQYLQSNPASTVKIFLYTPSIGVGNPEEWDWIILLKN